MRLIIAWITIGFLVAVAAADKQPIPIGIVHTFSLKTLITKLTTFKERFSTRPTST